MGALAVETSSTRGAGGAWEGGVFDFSDSDGFGEDEAPRAGVGRLPWTGVGHQVLVLSDDDTQLAGGSLVRKSNRPLPQRRHREGQRRAPLSALVACTLISGLAAGAPPSSSEVPGARCSRPTSIRSGPAGTRPGPVLGPSTRRSKTSAWAVGANVTVRAAGTRTKSASTTGESSAPRIDFGW